MLLAFIVNLNAADLNISAFSTIVLIKFVGTGATVLLLMYENDKSNAFVKEMCGTGTKTNCDSILSSKVSKILGISWGEIGFFYFAATTALILFPGIPFVDKTIWLSLLNITAVPYTLFSVYYQWRIAKQWCRLCLTVQAVLLLELIWSILNFWTVSHPSFYNYFLQSPFINIVSPILILGTIIITWYGIKPALVKARNADLYESAYKRLQYNPEIFHGLLHQQFKAPDGWQDLGINVGNPTATNTIIKVCNPYCGPCAKAHLQLEQILERNEDVKLKIIFTATNNEHDNSAVVVKHLLRIAAEGNPAKTQKSLDYWYSAENKDYQAFAKKYPLSKDYFATENQVDAMSKWCTEAEITFTPTIFVNGFRLPENYNVEELKNIFD